MFFDKKSASPRVKRIPVELIDPNPAQPRRSFDRNDLAALAQSIKENGLLSPVSVRRRRQRYQLIAGERRLLAFRLLGETTIPAIIEEADDHRSAVLALVENLQRKELNFYEEALAISSLITACELTQQQTAEKLGMSQSAVANKLRLLRLPEQLLQTMARSNLSERHARALLPLAEDERLKPALERVIREKLNVAQTERLVDSMLRQAAPPPKGARIFLVKDLRIFNHAIDKAVDMMKQAGIEAVSRKTEDEQNIVYTVVIPKKKPAAVEKSSQAPASKAL